ncbi:MAG: restriction endonuclease subunit S [Methylobacter sp.]
MSNLPVSWINVQLGDVVDYGNTSKVEPTEIAEDSWILELEDIEKTSSKLTQRMLFSERQSKSTKNKFEKNDVLYGKLRPYLDKVIIANESGYCTTEIIPIKPGKFLDSRFLFYGLKRKEFIDYVAKVSHGLNMPRLGTKQGQAAPFVLVPLNEQIRIANKLDSVLAKVDAAQARLEKIPTLLKRFRQSVLAAATSGELTREWRETNGIHLDQWSWKKLSDIAEIQGGVTKDSKKQSDVDEEIPYLRVANVQRGYMDLTEIKTIRIPRSKLEKLLLESGDVLFNEGGDLDKLGRGWIWENQITRCSFQNHVFRARLYDSTNNPKYVSWWGNTEGHEYFIRQGKQTTNLASINKTILSNLPINMPPAEEQLEIVRRVESLFTLADTVEKQYLETKKRTDRLTQSLLAKAFRGELVPQDPNDEPVAELLKRIQAERQQQAAEKPKRKVSTRSSQNTVVPQQPKINTMQLRDAPENYLLELLAQLGGETHAEVLWKKSELAIDDFYAKLKQEMQTNGIVEDKNSPDPALRKLKVANY